MNLHNINLKGYYHENFTDNWAVYICTGIYRLWRSEYCPGRRCFKSCSRLYAGAHAMGVCYRRRFSSGCYKYHHQCLLENCLYHLGLLIFLIAFSVYGMQLIHGPKTAINVLYGQNVTANTAMGFLEALAIGAAAGWRHTEFIPVGGNRKLLQKGLLWMISLRGNWEMKNDILEQQILNYEIFVQSKPNVTRSPVSFHHIPAMGSTSKVASISVSLQTQVKPTWKVDITVS